MDRLYKFSEFLRQFPNDDACLEEIKKLHYYNGIYCIRCDKDTKHYKVKSRKSYACEYCRFQIYPLAGTIFEKTSTPLRVWFFAIYLMTQTRADISIRDLQNELGVTYKTAWRIYTNIYNLMELHDGDLLKDPNEEKSKVFKWKIFNKFELTITQKEKPLIG